MKNIVVYNEFIISPNCNPHRTTQIFNQIRTKFVLSFSIYWTCTAQCPTGHLKVGMFWAINSKRPKWLSLLSIRVIIANLIKPKALSCQCPTIGFFMWNFHVISNLYLNSSVFLNRGSCQLPYKVLNLL